MVLADEDGQSVVEGELGMRQDWLEPRCFDGRSGQGCGRYGQECKNDQVAQCIWDVVPEVQHASSPLKGQARGLLLHLPIGLA